MKLLIWLSGLTKQKPSVHTFYQVKILTHDKAHIAPAPLWGGWV